MFFAVHVDLVAGTVCQLPVLATPYDIWEPGTEMWGFTSPEPYSPAKVPSQKHPPPLQKKKNPGGFCCSCSKRKTFAFICARHFVFSLRVVSDAWQFERNLHCSAVRCRAASCFAGEKQFAQVRYELQYCKLMSLAVKDDVLVKGGRNHFCVCSVATAAFYSKTSASITAAEIQQHVCNVG